MALSKAFDCLPNDQIIEKLKTYGVSDSSCRLMASYLSNRTQRVKIGKVVSSWAKIIKGVPQGSILGPLIFKIFIKNIFFILSLIARSTTMQMITQSRTGTGKSTS